MLHLLHIYLTTKIYISKEFLAQESLRAIYLYNGVFSFEFTLNLKMLSQQLRTHLRRPCSKWPHIRPFAQHRGATLSAGHVTGLHLPRPPQAIHVPHMAKRQRLGHVLG